MSLFARVSSRRRETASRALRATVVVALVAGGMSVVSSLATPAAAAPSTTFSDPSGPASYVVPDGVTTIRIAATGGAGGNGSLSRIKDRDQVVVQDGGKGAPGTAVTLELAVTPGQKLTVNVGGGGASAVGTGGFGTSFGASGGAGSFGGGAGGTGTSSVIAGSGGGGGGGGASWVSSGDDRLVVAGGGGGGGGAGTPAPGVNGTGSSSILRGGDGGAGASTPGSGAGTVYQLNATVVESYALGGAGGAAPSNTGGAGATASRGGGGGGGGGGAGSCAVASGAGAGVGGTGGRYSTDQKAHAAGGGGGAGGSCASLRATNVGYDRAPTTTAGAAGSVVISVPQATTTSVGLIDNPTKIVRVGFDATFRATVTPNDGVGVVDFLLVQRGYPDDRSLCSGVPVNASGIATCTGGAGMLRSAGGYGVRAVFRGTATAQGSSSGNYDFFAGDLTPVTISPGDTTVDQQQKVTLRAQVPADNRTITWTLSDGRTFERNMVSRVATLDNLTFSQAGPVTVTASYPGAASTRKVDGPGSDTITLTVTDKVAADRLVFTPTGATVIDPGGSVTFTLTERNTGGEDSTNGSQFYLPSLSPEGSCTKGRQPREGRGGFPVTCTASRPGPHTLSARMCSQCIFPALPASVNFHVRGPGTQLGGYTARADFTPTVVFGEPFRVVSPRLLDEWGYDVGPYTGVTPTYSVPSGGGCARDVCWSDAPGAVTVEASAGDLQGSARITTGERENIAAIPLRLVPSGPAYLGQPVTWRFEAVAPGGGPASFDVTASTFLLDGAIEFGGMPGRFEIPGQLTIVCASGRECTITIQGPGRHVLTVRSHGYLNSEQRTFGYGAVSTAFDVTRPDVATAIEADDAFVAAGEPVTFTARSLDAAGGTVADITAGATFGFADDQGTCVGNRCVSTTPGPHRIIMIPADAGLPRAEALMFVAGKVYRVDIAVTRSVVTAGADVDLTAWVVREFTDAIVDETRSATFTVQPESGGEALECGGVLGSCTPRAAGRYLLRATVEGVQSKAVPISVLPGPEAGLVVDFPSTARAGQYVDGSSWFVDAWGNRLGPAPTVADDGAGNCWYGPECLFRTAGDHFVTFTAGEFRAMATVAVTPGTPDRVRLTTPQTTPVEPGEPVFADVSGTDAYGNDLPDLRDAVELVGGPDVLCDARSCWSLVLGRHQFTARYEGGTTAPVEFFVVPGAPTAFDTTGPSSAVAGTDLAFPVQWRDRVGNVVDGPRGYPEVYVEGADGRFECEYRCRLDRPGDYTVRATWFAFGNERTEIATLTRPLTVSAGPASSFALDTAGEWAAGSTNTVSVSATDAAGNPVPVPTDAGLVLGVAPDGRCDAGSCTVARSGPHRVSVYRDGQEVAGADVVVRPGPLAGLSVSVPDTLLAGAPLRPVITATDADGNGLDLANATLSVTPDGSCTADSCSLTQAGVHTVTVTVGDRTASATVTVQPNADGERRTTVDAPDTWTAGRPVTVTPVMTDPYGNALDVPAEVSVTVGPDGSCDGRVCTVATAGPHRVRVMSSDTELAARDVTVVAGAPAALRLSAPLTVTAGQTFDVTATATDAQGNDLGSRTPTLTISPDGSCDGTSCTATVAGVHTVTATSGDLTATATVTVVPDAGLRVSLDAPATWTAGAAVTVGVTSTDSHGNAVPTPSDARVVIGPDGSCDGTSCTATKAGAHRVGVVRGDSEVAGRDVTVVAGALAALRRTADGPAVAGQDLAVGVNGVDAYGNDLGARTATLSIGPDGSCTGGTCRATVAGPHVVTATFDGVTSTFDLTVSPAAPTSLRVTPPTTWRAGDTVPVAVSGTDRFGNAIPAVSGAKLTARSRPCTGTACRVTLAGPTVVTAVLGTVRASVPVTVTPAATVRLVLTPSAATVVSGNAVTMTTTGRDVFGNSTGPVAASYTVNGGETCTGASCLLRRAGARIVTATAGDLTARTVVRVTAGAPASLRMTLSAVVVAPGGVVTARTWTLDAAGNVVAEVTAGTAFVVGSQPCDGNRCTLGRTGGQAVATYGGWQAVVPVRVGGARG